MPKFFSKSSDTNPVVPALIGIVLLLGLAAAFYLVSVPQDIRQQAAGSCSEAPVNVQFRRTAEADRPWKSGSEMNLKVGDTIDINCFSKNGASLLTGGQILGAVVEGTTVSEYLTLPSSGTQIRNYTLQTGGEHVYVCTNSARSCIDRDGFTVAGGAVTPPPVEDPGDDVPPADDIEDEVTPPGPADEAPGSECNEVADLNQDCRVDIQDYNIFLRNFRNSFDAGN